MPITFIGILAPRSATKSSRSVPTRGSSTRAQYSRIWGSRANIFFGVKTRERMPRWAVCSGGSSKMKTPEGSSIGVLMSSRMSLLAELYVW